MRKLALLTAFSAVLFLGTANAATLYYTDGSNRLTVKDDGDSSNGTTLGSTAR